MKDNHVYHEEVEYDNRWLRRSATAEPMLRWTVNEAAVGLNYASVGGNAGDIGWSIENCRQYVDNRMLLPECFLNFDNHNALIIVIVVSVYGFMFSTQIFGQISNVGTVPLCLDSYNKNPSLVTWYQSFVYYRKYDRQIERKSVKSLFDLTNNWRELFYESFTQRKTVLCSC